MLKMMMMMMMIWYIPMPHHLSHALNTQKTVQDLTFPVLQRHSIHPPHITSYAPSSPGYTDFQLSSPMFQFHMSTHSVSGHRP